MHFVTNPGAGSTFQRLRTLSDGRHTHQGCFPHTPKHELIISCKHLRISTMFAEDKMKCFILACTNNAVIKDRCRHLCHVETSYINLSRLSYLNHTEQCGRMIGTLYFLALLSSTMARAVCIEDQLSHFYYLRLLHVRWCAIFSSGPFFLSFVACRPVDQGPEWDRRWKRGQVHLWRLPAQFHLSSQRAGGGRAESCGDHTQTGAGDGKGTQAYYDHVRGMFEASEHVSKRSDSVLAGRLWDQADIIFRKDNRADGRNRNGGEEPGFLQWCWPGRDQSED